MMPMMNASARKGASSSPSAPIIAIGQSYQGGTIFYVDGTGQHGLIAYTADLSASTWFITKGNAGTSETFGTGASNTSRFSTSYAIWHNLSLFNANSPGGHNTWFIPDIAQLMTLIPLLTRSLDSSDSLYQKFGTVTSGVSLWSSSEYSGYPSDYADIGIISSNSQSLADKTGTWLGARPVLAF